MADADDDTGRKDGANDDGKDDAHPWGDDFDAAKAWRLVSNLREELKTIKGERDAAKTKLQEREDAEKSDAEKAIARAEKAEREAADLRREALVAKVAKEKNVPDDLIEFLTGANEEELTAKADRLSKYGAGKSDDKDDDKDDDNGGRPKPNLKGSGGQGGDDGGDADDPASIVKAIRGN